MFVDEAAVGLSGTFDASGDGAATGQHLHPVGEGRSFQSALPSLAVHVEVPSAMT